jgi:hypothetical protein
MRRLHRNKAARERMEELGLDEAQVDTNQDGEISGEELQAAMEQIEQSRLDALRALGVNV